MPKRKLERGILGQPKDPKNQILYVFNGENWPSDDSDDSTYSPDGEPSSSHRKSTKKRAKKETAKIKRPKTSSAATTSSKESCQMLHLPPEIMLKIFQDVVRMDGIVPFYKRASKVCKMWQELSRDVSLWESVDLSFGWIKKTRQTLEILCDQYQYLPRVKHLNLGGWSNLNLQIFQILKEKCPLLESISLSNCSKLHPEGIEQLVHFKKLNGITMSSLKDGQAKILTHSLPKIMATTGAQLVNLDISGNNIPASMSSLLNKIMTISDDVVCSNLQVLDLSQSEFREDTPPIDDLQFGCPLLRALRLSFTSAWKPVPKNLEAPGFSSLCELSITTLRERNDRSQTGPDNTSILKLLHASEKLKILNLRGCNRLTSECLHSLPLTNLECLYIAKTKLTSDGFQNFIATHKSSLLELDVSNSVPPLEDELDEFAADGNSCRLEKLDVTSSRISAASVKKLLKKCSNVSQINLTSCRNLPIGVKRCFTGSSQLKELKKLLG